MAYMNSVLWSALCGVPRCVPAVFASSRNATEGAPYRVKPAGKFRTTYSRPQNKG